MANKTCRVCGKSHPTSHFAKRRNDCKDCRPHADRLRKFGITRSQFLKMRKKQKDKCAICSAPLGKSPHVDHCHSKGHIRGLLCSNCNVGLGLFNDNIGSLKAAVVYLKQHQGRAVA